MRNLNRCGRALLVGLGAGSGLLNPGYATHLKLEGLGQNWWVIPIVGLVPFVLVGGIAYLLYRAARTKDPRSKGER